MRKPKPAPGISARLPAIFKAAKPDGMSMRKWMEAAKVSPKFVNDIEDGAEPGIDKVERMANAVGLTLTELIEGKTAGANTQPPANELNIDMLARAIADVQPAYAAAQGDPDASLKAANAIASVFRAVARNPTIPDDQANWAMVVEFAVDAFFGPTAPKLPSEPSTQRHKSGNS